jgi:4-hydroxy-3-methylbut-2-enyl diphosphate reductase
VIEVRTAGKLGYCSGVSQAIKQAQQYGDKHGSVFSLGTVAHNEDVVALLKAHGVEPISPDRMEAGTHMVITAHGAPPDLYKKIEELGCEFLDCTCPIVKKAQQTVRNLAADLFDIVIFGDPEHQEIKGLVGWAFGHAKFVGHQNQLFTPGQNHKALGLGKRIGVVSQTTKVPADYADFISTLVNYHIEGFWELRIYDTICPIVATRVNDTFNLAQEVDMMFVVGSKESANTRNLERVCRQGITRVKGLIEPWAVNLVQNEDQVNEALAEFFNENDIAFPKIGVTAGTSTPIEVVAKVVAKIEEVLHGR